MILKTIFCSNPITVQTTDILTHSLHENLTKIFCFYCSVEEVGVPSNEDTSTKHRLSLIDCIVCKRSHCCKTYRRHLGTHVKNGELEADDVNKIMFGRRITRCDIKKVHDKIQTGHVCHYENHLKQKCGHLVLDLKRHLASVHNLDRHCSEFEDLFIQV